MCRALDQAGHLVSFSAHVNLPYRIVSYRIFDSFSHWTLHYYHRHHHHYHHATCSAHIRYCKMCNAYVNVEKLQTIEHIAKSSGKLE